MSNWIIDVLWFIAIAVASIGAFWIPIGLVVAYHSQVEEVRSGERQNRSVVLGVFATIAGTAWILVMLFIVIPHAVTELIPSLYGSVSTIVATIFRWLFTGFAGLILAALFGLLLLIIVVVVIGWALRLGWNLHKGPRL